MDPLPALPVVAGAGAYALRVRTLRRRGRPPAARKQVWFAAGILVLLAALLPPIDTTSDTKFWVHMSQHLLLGDIAPLLIVLGLDGALLRPLLATRGAWHLRVAANPLFALPLWILVLSAWHLPAPYDAALHHDWLHALEHFSFFLAGALMWAAVVEPLPGPDWFGTGPKAVYTLLIRACGAILASVFIWSNSAFYDHYSVHDQRIGGLIMFTEGGVVTLLVFAWLFLRWSSEAERRQQLIEQGHDPELAQRTARHWPRLQQPPGPPRSAPSRAGPDRPSGR